MTAPLTADQANAVYDLLVAHAGANDDDRIGFFFTQTDGYCAEYRFQGLLGFGGKFWNSNNRWYVSCYREDLTPVRQAAIDATNAALARLREQVTL